MAQIVFALDGFSGPGRALSADASPVSCTAVGQLARDAGTESTECLCRTCYQYY